MDVNVRVTVDLGDRTMALFSGMMAANESMKRATDTVHRVLEKYADAPAPEPKAPADPEPAPEPAPAPAPATRPARVSRARRVAVAAPVPEPEIVKAEAPAPAPEAEAEAEAAKPEAHRADAVSHDDARDLMAEVIGADMKNRDAVLDWLGAHIPGEGAKAVGNLPAEYLRGFCDFLTDLKNK